MECAIVNHHKETGGNGMKIGKEGLRKLKASIANIALFLSIFVVLFPLAFPTVRAAGDIWYVGTGPGNHTTSVEYAVEQLAQDGDIVRVWPGNYYEYTIEIENTITLESIDGRDVTTIQPPPSSPGTVITISASWVNVTGFT